MKILAIDSSTEVCSVALGNGAAIYQEENRSRAGHSQMILELVARVLDETQEALGNLDLIAVDVGPGSFTGLRIGLGVAKGIAYASRLPVVGISSLEILSQQSPAGIAAPAIDARMGEVYNAVYEVKPDSRPSVIGSVHVLNPEDVDLPVSGHVTGLGSGWDNYAEAMLQLGQENICILANRVPQARDLVRLAALTNREDWVSAVDLEAAYVRDRVVQLSTPPA